VSRLLSSTFLLAAKAHGISEAELERQWLRLQSGPSYCQPEGACQRGNGIETLTDEDLNHWSAKGQDLKSHEAIRFVPASGAASRMFKSLATKNAEALEQLDARWHAFPFRALAEATGPCDRVEDRLEAVMKRLALPDMPKGGLPFHLYPEGTRTAFEEHMREWRETMPNTTAWEVHFTLSEENRSHWETELSRWAQDLGVKVSTSIQHPSTDTIALDDEGQPFTIDGSMPLFRPGGHGSLLFNLSEIGKRHPGAMVSVKNIDNVRPGTAFGEVIPWRRALLGLTYDLNQSRLQALRALDDGNEAPARHWLARGFLHPTDSGPQDREGLVKALDRPLLVAGMVRNEGEPGGGPFWLRDAEGTLRAQIVESAEMDLGDPRIGNCIAEATHFNPVDLVCVLHGPDGNPYPLELFTDVRRDFLVTKSHSGRGLIGLEHPGLWNGAMGRWNTLFVEVPSRTFAPVKTVFDLLRPAHKV